MILLTYYKPLTLSFATIIHPPSHILTLIFLPSHTIICHCNPSHTHTPSSATVIPLTPTSHHLPLWFLPHPNPIICHYDPSHTHTLSSATIFPPTHPHHIICHCNPSLTPTPHHLPLWSLPLPSFLTPPRAVNQPHIPSTLPEPRMRRKPSSRACTAKSASWLNIRRRLQSWKLHTTTTPMPTNAMSWCRNSTELDLLCSRFGSYYWCVSY